MKNVRQHATHAAVLISALAAVVMAGNPDPVCVDDYSLPGGACSKHVDTTDPDLCQDEPISSDECKEAFNATSGWSQRSNYSASCTMRQKTWSSQHQDCISTNLPPVNYRCSEASGTVCPGGGCGTCN